MDPWVCLNQNHDVGWSAGNQTGIIPVEASLTPADTAWRWVGGRRHRVFSSDRKTTRQWIFSGLTPWISGDWCRGGRFSVWSERDVELRGIFPVFTFSLWFLIRPKPTRACETLIFMYIFLRRFCRRYLTNCVLRPKPEASVAVFDSWQTQLHSHMYIIIFTLLPLKHFGLRGSEPCRGLSGLCVTLKLAEWRF